MARNTEKNIFFLSLKNTKKEDNIYNCIQNTLTLLKKNDKMENIMQYFTLNYM